MAGGHGPISRCGRRRSRPPSVRAVGCRLPQVSLNGCRSATERRAGVVRQHWTGDALGNRSVSPPRWTRLLSVPTPPPEHRPARRHPRTPSRRCSSKAYVERAFMSAPAGDLWRVALFLPFGRNKRRQRKAKRGTRRKRRSSDFYWVKCAVRQLHATNGKERLTFLFPPVNRRVAGSNPA